MKKNARAHHRGHISRRAFVGGAGLGAGVVAAGGRAALVGAAVPPDSRTFARSGAVQSPLNFGRMFPGLLPFAAPTDDVKAALREVGRPGGIMDANDDLAAGPVALIVDANLNLVNRNNTTHTAGTTFVGQFLDHDVTFDATSPLGVPTDPERTRNTRVPALDLDTVYGGGPSVSPQLYQSNDRAKLRIENGRLFEDVPRHPDGSAIIADPRNDENLVISGLQAAFIEFHNHMVDTVRSERLVSNRRSASEVFQEARRQTRWHYQNMILTQFLPQIVGQAMVDDILRRGRRFYRSAYEGYMPVEFQTGAYRMGHSMVRPSYRANFTGQPQGKPTRRSSSASSSTPRRRVSPTRRTCAGAHGPRGGSLAGRRSSTSAMGTSGPTRPSTRSSRRRCSSCRCSPSPVAIRPPRAPPAARFVLTVQLSP